MQAFCAATLHSPDASGLDQILSSYSEDLLVETSAIVNENPFNGCSCGISYIHKTFSADFNRGRSYSAEV